MRRALRGTEQIGLIQSHPDKAGQAVLACLLILLTATWAHAKAFAGYWGNCLLRLGEREGRGFVATGVALVVAGTAGLAATLSTAVPVWFVVPAWPVAGLVQAGVEAGQVKDTKVKPFALAASSARPQRSEYGCPPAFSNAPDSAATSAADWL